MMHMTSRPWSSLSAKVLGEFGQRALAPFNDVLEYLSCIAQRIELPHDRDQRDQAADEQLFQPIVVVCDVVIVPC